jgi:hypothetical protein
MEEENLLGVIPVGGYGLTHSMISGIFPIQLHRHSKTSLTGLLPASPVRKGGVKGRYTKMAIFLTGKPRPGGRGGFTLQEACSCILDSA